MLFSIFDSCLSYPYITLLSILFHLITFLQTVKGLLLPPSIAREPGLESESEFPTEYDVKLLFSPMSNNIRQSNSSSFKNNVNESNTSSHSYPTKSIFELIVKGKLLQNMIPEKPEKSEKSNSSLSVPNKFEVMYFLRLLHVLLLPILMTVEREISYFFYFIFALFRLFFISQL